MNTKKSSKRKAISPILATVILIAITLVAAVAMAGFVFGLFGTLSSGANVQVSVTSCTGSSGICVLALSNTGSAPATANSCTIYGASAGVTGTTSVGAGKSGVAVTCTITTLPSGGFAAGTMMTGTVAMSNGIAIPFTGIWR